MVHIDKSLEYLRESQNASFTILMWNLSKDELILKLKHKLALISTIKNTFKKVKLNDRLYKYLTAIEKSSNQMYSQIVLIGKDTHIIKLDEKDIKMLEEYSIPKFTIENDEYFNISWLKDLFENFTMYDIIISNSAQTDKLTCLTHWVGNLNKKKIIKQNVNTDYIKSLTTPWFMVGKLNPQNKTKYMIEHYPNVQNNMCWKDIINQIELIEMNKKVNELEKHIESLCINSNKYAFGSDIYELIEQYNIKELYLHNDAKKQFDDMIMEKDLSSCINFNIIEICTNNLDKSNIADLFKKNYSGILGIKYY